MAITFYRKQIFSAENVHALEAFSEGNVIVKNGNSVSQKFFLMQETGWLRQLTPQYFTRCENFVCWELLDDENLRLGHLRYHKNPQWLIKLKLNCASGIWLSETTHHCGKDDYRASLVCEANHVLLKWHVRGSKSYDQEIYYYAL